MVWSTHLHAQHPAVRDFVGNNPELFAGWDDPIAHNPAADDPVLLGELLLYFFEWAASHKVTDACAKAVHSLLRLLLPRDQTFPGWYQLKALLEAVNDNCVVAVDLCPNDCIAFYDCNHPSLSYQHAHRESCLYCGASRYITAGEDRKAVRQGFYVPMDSWLAGLFKDPDLNAHLEHDMGEFPPGHVRHSFGWHAKVTANPHINGETRNQAVIGMADGIPLFRDKNSRSVVPIALRLANLPDPLSKRSPLLN